MAQQTITAVLAAAPAALQSVNTVRLDGPADLIGFRRAARALLAQRVEPDLVRWSVVSSPELDLFAENPGPSTAHPASPQTATAPSPPITVPAAFGELVAHAGLHRDPHRFALLYRLLWRLQHEPALRHDPLDAEWMQAAQMARAVRRDAHKMRAFVRLRPLQRPDGDGTWHVAWFEPDHHVLEATAPFFSRRFANLHWAILTPDRCASWDGVRLSFSPGANPQDAPPADAGEALWLTYYQSIFNPARLKVDAMVREMPRRYWKNLPEATLIRSLTAEANGRNALMIDRPAQGPRRRVRAPIAVHSAPLSPAPDRMSPVVENLSPTQRSQAWAEARDAACRCTQCPLHAQATQTVFGEGPLNATLMLVGEQPGDHEDLRGRPFTGPAGQLLDAALLQLGVDRQQAYVTNAVKHFKFELRGQRRLHKTASQQEVADCLDWLEREIALVQPQALVALGGTAARSLLGRPVSVMQARGQWHARDDGRPVLVTLHPSALLRLPEGERAAMHHQWLSDLAQAAAWVDSPGRGGATRPPLSAQFDPGTGR